MQYYLIAVIGLQHSKSAAFTYHFEQPLPIGAFVRVSVGRKVANGIVLKKVAKPAFPTKPVQNHLVPEWQLPPQLVHFADWLAAYYTSHLGLVLQSMLPSGLHKTRRAPKQAAQQSTRTKKEIAPTPDQATAIAAINTSSDDAFLLHGVPGSGKTFVYIQAATHTIASGRSVILLVPEIALTSQLIAEFANYFDDIAVMHSAMTEAERHQVWQRILTSTTPMIVVGPRSALFSPLQNVGLIIVDECHEQSFKQDRSPRYHAVYAARALAKLHRAKIVLGSATPGVTEYYLAQQGRIQLLQMPKAIQPRNNIMKLLPHRDRTEFSRHRFMSNSLISAIETALANNQQALIFHNRRGTAPVVICEECGWQAECPSCNLPLTYHGDQLHMRCHSCNFSQPVVHTCPSCRNPTIVFKGIGTKLVESEVQRLFPRARVARFDTDNSKDQQLQNRYQELYDGHIDILVGTQVLAKGLDLPHLAVVGVLQADSGLGLPDFSARERVFQLLYQVNGRAGRSDSPGQVFLQTYLPQEKTILQAADANYADFYHTELAARKQNWLPPFSFLLKVTYGTRTELAAVKALKKFAQKISADYPQVRIVGPAPGFHERLNGLYHWQLVIKSAKRSTLQQIIAEIPNGWQYDLDPVSLL